MERTDPILDAFFETGAYLKGHFRLTSGLHSPEYLQCALVLQHPRHAEHFGRLLAAEFRRLEPTLNVGIVASPAIGGLIIGHEVARALGARFLFTERDASGKMVLRRGFSVEPGETAVVVEDVVTTGGSSREVIDILKDLGARVLAAGSIIDRSGGAADLGVPRVALKTRCAAPVVQWSSRDRGRSMRRIRIQVAYDGSDYHGWQVQPGLSTVQGTLEQVFGQIEGRPVHVAGSGRTDAGVHALAQVAAVDMENPIPLDNLRRAANRLLPADIRVTRVEEAAPSFNPRYDAKAKTYEYRLYRGEICPPFERRYLTHHPYPLDVAAMTEAASLIEGEHDFTAFAASDERDEQGASKVRTVFCSRLSREPDRLIYRVTGSGFLKHMVRNVVGVLLEVGKGNIDRDGLLARLEPGCGIPPGPTAPARGLLLISVEY